jgi:hypothetical protein
VVDVHVVHARLFQAIGEPAGVGALAEAAELQGHLVARDRGRGRRQLGHGRARPGGGIRGGNHAFAAARIARAHRLEFNVRGAGAVHAQANRGGVAQVHHAPVVEGPRSLTRTIRLRPLSRLVTRTKLGSGSVLCAGGEGADVVQLAAGRGAAVELGAVPGSKPALMEAVRAVEHAVALAEHVYGERLP